MDVFLRKNNAWKSRLGFLIFFYLLNFYFLERLEPVLGLKINFLRFQYAF